MSLARQSVFGDDRILAWKDNKQEFKLVVLSRGAQKARFPGGPAAFQQENHLHFVPVFFLLTWE